MTREEMDFINDECETEAYEESCRDNTVICECDYCGEDIHEWDTMTAIITADGKDINHYCEYCVGRKREFVHDLCEAAGLWYETGWADDTESAAQAERQRRKKLGYITPKQVLVIQKGVRA